MLSTNRSPAGWLRRKMLHLTYMEYRLKSKGMLSTLNAFFKHFAGDRTTPFLVNLAWMKQKYSPIDARFSTISIETMSGCNYRCSFCPIGKIPMPSGRMSLELYQKILSQLSNFHGEIHLFLFNEPLLDKRLLDFIRLAREMTPARIVIQTNGSKLTREMAEALTEHAVVILNDYREDNAILNEAREYGIKKNFILRDRKPNETLSNRAGNLPDRPVVYLDQFCTRPFRQMFISFNGKAVLCCQDWSYEEVMGDVNENTLDEIWNNERYRKVRESLMNRERYGLCAKCDFAGIEG